MVIYISLTRASTPYFTRSTKTYTYNLKNNIYIAFLTHCTHKYWNIFIQRGWDVGIICFAYKWEGEKNHKTELSSRILKKGRKKPTSKH